MEDMHKMWGLDVPCLALLALDALSCLGFQLGLNEAQFEALGDSVHYFCSYYGLKIQSPKKYGGQIHGPKRKIKLYYYSQTNQWPKLIRVLLCQV